MKKKHNVVGALGKTAVALTLISTCLVGGTLAKYTSEVTGTGTAIAAKWSFKGNAGTNSASETALGSFDLATTKTANTNVTSTKIAPGDKGTVALNYDLTGTEVKTKVTAYVQVTTDQAAKLPTNLEIKTSSGSWVKASTLTNYTEIGTVTKTVTDISSTATGKLDVEWRWELDESGNTNKDTQDTSDGKETTKTSTGGTINVKLVAEQLAQ